MVITIGLRLCSRSLVRPQIIGLKIDTADGWYCEQNAKLDIRQAAPLKVDVTISAE